MSINVSHIFISLFYIDTLKSKTLNSLFSFSNILYILNVLVNCASIHSFRFALSSMDMELKDYDSRTALHISAAEGEFHATVFICGSRHLVNEPH